MRRYLAIGVLVGAGLAFTYFWNERAQPVPVSGDLSAQTEMVAVVLPDLTADAQIGARAFGAKCAACHGPNAGGIEGSGPPLIHKIYEPGHHGDMSFVLAARRGVQSHHWRFGNMPPVDAITDAEISAIIAFVRAVQHENGIF